MSASKHFEKRFRAKNLRQVYVEKIRESQAIGIDRMRPASLPARVKVVVASVMQPTVEYSRQANASL